MTGCRFVTCRDYFDLVDGISEISCYGRLLRQHRLTHPGCGRGYIVSHSALSAPILTINEEMDIASILIPMTGASRITCCREDCGPKYPDYQKGPHTVGRAALRPHVLWSSPAANTVKTVPLLSPTKLVCTLTKEGEEPLALPWHTLRKYQFCLYILLGVARRSI